jgi:hypothetical protein
VEQLQLQAEAEVEVELAVKMMRGVIIIVMVVTMVDLVAEEEELVGKVSLVVLDFLRMAMAIKMEAMLHVTELWDVLMEE